MKTASAMTRALVLGAIVTAAIAVVGSTIGYLVAGIPGLLSALVAAALTAFFMGSTTLSVYVADRVTKSRPSTRNYFSIIIGAWAFKFVVIFVLFALVQGQPWLNTYVFFFTLVVAVIGSLVGDIIAMAGAQVSSTTGLAPPVLETTPEVPE